MKRNLFALLLVLLWAQAAGAQWFRDDCADLNSTAIAGVTDCVQNTTTAGRIAGRTYTFVGGTAWREKASITEVNSQTGTSYTFVNADSRKLVTFSNASSITVTLPQAGSGSSFLSSWFVDVQNRGAGTATITPGTSTIDGAASLALTTNQGVRIFSDGANYFTQRGVGGSGGGPETDPIIRAINGLVKCDGANCSAGVPNTDYPALAHATRHQSGGADPVGTATPAANAIPQAGAGGLLNQGWVGSGVYDGSQHYVADAGSNDTYTGCTPNPIAAYVTGMWIDLRPNTINTGAATINVCSLGARPIVQHDNSVLTDGLLAAGRPYRLTFDGTSFRMPSGGGGGSLTGTGTAGKIPRWTSPTALGDSGCSDDGTGNLSCGDVSANYHQYTGVAPTGVREHRAPDASGTQTYRKEIVLLIGDRVTGAVLTDAHDYPLAWPNGIAAMTIVEVKCWSDAGAPIINLQRDDGSAANILSSNLTCTTGGASGSISGAEDNLALGNNIGFVMVTAGGVAKEVIVMIVATLDL